MRTAGVVNFLLSQSSSVAAGFAVDLPRCREFPFALASAGEIRSESGMTVGALPGPVEDLKPEDVEPENLEKGALVTNSSDASSLYLDGEVTIVGDAQHLGGYAAPGNVTFREGGPVQLEEAQNLPQIPIEGYDPGTPRR